LTDSSSPHVPRLSVVIPVFDEESIVRAACEELAAELDARGWDYELVLSENGSRDRTAEVLAALAAEKPRLRFLRTAEPNYGLALRRGILDARGRYVVCDEIDLCDVRFYDRALAVLDADGADLVVGSKRAPGSHDHRPAYRRVAATVHNALLRAALRFRGTDTHGVKAFVRERLAPTVERCITDKDVFAAELVLRAGLEGLRVVEIPISLEEKRPPSIALFRRVPDVLRQLAKLVWVLRVAPDASARAGGRPASKEKPGKAAGS
jgi:glycosyltransferase involved in cell wall biosynthesis